MTQPLPELPDDTFSIQSPFWEKILEWHDAPAGEEQGEAGPAADALENCVRRMMHAYALTAIEHAKAKGGEAARAAEIATLKRWVNLIAHGGEWGVVNEIERILARTPTGEQHHE